MAKPIFLIGAKNPEKLGNVIDGKITDYHVLVYPIRHNGYEFNVFYEKDFTDIKFAELKEFINQAML